MGERGRPLGPRAFLPSTRKLSSELAAGSWMATPRRDYTAHEATRPPLCLVRATSLTAVAARLPPPTHGKSARGCDGRNYSVGMPASPERARAGAAGFRVVPEPGAADRSMTTATGPLAGAAGSSVGPNDRPGPVSSPTKAPTSRPPCRCTSSSAATTAGPGRVRLIRWYAPARAVSRACARRASMTVRSTRLDQRQRRAPASAQPGVCSRACRHRAISARLRLQRAAQSRRLCQGPPRFTLVGFVE
jgi:hypothetical protein